VVVFGQNSTHDAPLEVEGRSVHVYFRTDTLIDPQQAKLLTGVTPEQILQHTHEQEHRLRIYSPHRRPKDIQILPSDEMHFRLAGKRRFFGLFPGKFMGFVTVKPKEIGGSGKWVGGHAAKANENHEHARCSGLTHDALARCVAANLKTDDQRSLDHVWVVQAPPSFTWKPQGSPDIPALIQAAANAPSHKIARANATRVEFQLFTSSNSPAVFITRFFVVPKNGTIQGIGTEFRHGDRLVVCENRAENDDNGNFTKSEVCPAN
jgi:hypothetical protein